MLRTFVALSCLLAGGCLITTSGLAGPPLTDDDDGGADTSTSSPDSSEVESDGADAGEARAACSVLFCSDFDESDDVLSTWANSEVNSPGTIALDSTLWTSAPHSFVATLPPTSDTVDYNAALLAKYFGSVTKTQHVDMNVYLDQFDVSISGVSLGVMGLGTLTAHSQARFNILSASEAEIAEEYTDDAGSHSHASHGTYNWPLHQWIHVRVDVMATTISLAIDGVTYASIDKVGSWDEPQTLLKIGIYYALGQGGQRIAFDDVMFDAQ